MAKVEKETTATVRQIQRVQFGILGPDEIVCTV